MSFSLMRHSADWTNIAVVAVYPGSGGKEKQNNKKQKQ